MMRCCASSPTAVPPTRRTRYIFIVWMLGTSLVLIGVAIAFLRNQIRPILRLAAPPKRSAKAATRDFRPHGAREVRQAGYAFIEMKRRIERAMDQRTTMLNGVSHDLRTILTRFKLSLALMDDGAETRGHAERRRGNAAHARGLSRLRARRRRRGGGADRHARVSRSALKSDAERHGHASESSVSGETSVTVRPDAFKRCLANLVANAQRYGEDASTSRRRAISAFSPSMSTTTGRAFRPIVREDVFRPFFRLDEARNQDEGKAGPVSASRSPATSPVRMAATSRSPTALSAACARPCACRCDWFLGHDILATCQSSLSSSWPTPNKSLSDGETHGTSQLFAGGWERAALWRGPLLSTKTPRPCAILNDLDRLRIESGNHNVETGAGGGTQLGIEALR